MEKLDYLRFDFDDGKVIISYEDIAVETGVDVCVPNLEKCNFKRLEVKYVDESPQNGKSGKIKKTTIEKIITNPVEATESLQNAAKKEGGITLKNSDEDGEFILPSCTFTDITDREILVKEPVSELDLQTKGIWTNNGLRIINVKIENFPKSLKPQLDKCYLELRVRDGELLPDGPLRFGNTSNDAYQTRAFTVDEKTINGGIYLNTNLLGKVFKSGLSKSALFTGYFHIVCDQGIQYSFKFKLLVQNTNSAETCKSILSKYPAYIDFGTSSTCVCVWDTNANKPKLLSFDKMAGNGKNAFENPTSVIIYRWKSILKKFVFYYSDNKYSPILTAGGYDGGNFDSHINNSNFEFDSGHIVRKILNEEPTVGQLNSIISRIKTIPYMLNMLNQKRDDEWIFSYDDQDMPIQIISSEKIQDKKNINPVVIYGYLLGKMINNASDGCIYTNFEVSRPIKFPKIVVDEIRQSLEDGLKLSVPYTLWDKVKVTISKNNLEPVAYIGALIGKYIKVDKNEKKLFAVFDFGGGTLDTIFGALRNDENGMLSIDIYAQGGEETFGGESLIEKISFKLYSLNYQKPNSPLKGDDGSGLIPMRLPLYEDTPYDIPSDLTSGTREAKLNLQILGEKFSRHYFEGITSGTDESITISLLDTKGIRHEKLDLNINHVELDDYLENIIKPRIETFAEEMDIAFKEHLGSEYDRSSVTIFKAGNASRNKKLGSIMDNVFSENKDKISLPDDSSEKDFNPIYGITPKSAVALGQCLIKNKNIKVNIPECSPKWYVGYKEGGNNKFQHVLNKALKVNTWKEVTKKIPENPEYILSYTETLHYPTKPYVIDVSEDDYGKSLFIAIVDETKIKYCFADDEPDSSEPGSEITLD